MKRARAGESQEMRRAKGSVRQAGEKGATPTPAPSGTLMRSARGCCARLPTSGRRARPNQGLSFSPGGGGLDGAGGGGAAHAAHASTRRARGTRRTQSRTRAPAHSLSQPTQLSQEGGDLAAQFAENLVQGAPLFVENVWESFLNESGVGRARRSSVDV